MDPKLEKQITSDRDKWYRVFTVWSVVHYGVGILGVIAGVLATGALNIVGIQPIAGLVAAAASAVLSFLKPDKISVRYGAAWSTIAPAYEQFLAGNLDEKSLVDAHGKAINQIASQ